MQKIFYTVILIVGLVGNIYAAELDKATLPGENNRSRRLGTLAFKHGDYKHAIEFFTRYLNEVKEDKKALPDAYDCLIAAYNRAGDVKASEATLQRFNNDFPGVASLRKKLFEADILLLKKRYHQAEELYRAILATSIVDGRNYAHLLSGLAFAQLKQQQWGQAADTYELLTKTDKASGWLYESQLRRIKALIMDDQLDLAEKLLKQFNGHGHAMMQKRLQLLLLLKRKEYARFFSSYREVVKNLPRQPNAPFYDLASLAVKDFLDIPDIPKVLLLLKDCWSFAPTTFDRKNSLRLLINTAVRGGQLPEAIKWARQYIKLFHDADDLVEVKFQLARLLFEVNKNSEAETLYDGLMNDAKVPLQVKFDSAKELAAIFARSQHYAKAEKVLQFMVDNGRNVSERDEGKFMIGQLYLRQKKYNKAAAMFQAIATVQSSWRDRAIVQYIKALQLQKQYQAALKITEQSMRQKLSPVALRKISYLRGQLLESLKKFKEARNCYLDFVKKYPEAVEAPQAMFAAADIAYNERDFAMAATLFSDFAQRYPDNPRAANAIYKSVYANYFGDQYDTALQTVDRLFKQYPESKYTLAALLWKVDWLREQGQFSAAVKLLQTMQKKYGKQSATASRLLYELAVVSGKAGKTKQALDYLQTIFDKYSSATVAAAAYMLAGDLLSLNGQYAEAIKYYSHGARLRPDSTLEISCRGRLGDCNFDIFSKTNDKKYLEQAIAEYQSLLQVKHLPAAIRAQTLFKVGRSYELLNKIDQALSRYIEVINSYELDKAANPELPGLWAVKAANAALLIYQKTGTPAAARQAIEIYNTLERLHLNTGEDFSARIRALQEKYKLD